MGFLDELYFVQVARTDDERGGWRTIFVTPEEDTAEELAADQERAVTFVDGENVTDKGVTMARVVTVDDVLANEGIDGLTALLSETRVQLQQKLDASRRS